MVSGPIGKFSVDIARLKNQRSRRWSPSFWCQSRLQGSVTNPPPPWGEGGILPPTTAIRESPTSSQQDKAVHDQPYPYPLQACLQDTLPSTTSALQVHIDLYGVASGQKSTSRTCAAVQGQVSGKVARGRPVWTLALRQAAGYSSTIISGSSRASEGARRRRRGIRWRCSSRETCQLRLWRAGW